MSADASVTVPLLGIVIPDIWGLALVAAFSVLGLVFAGRTELHRILAGRGRVFARSILVGFSLLNVATVFSAAVFSSWNYVTTFITGLVGLVIYGIVANHLADGLAPTLMRQAFRMPAPVNLDLSSLNVHALRTTDPSSTDPGALRLRREGKRNVLSLPRGSVASSVLQHNGEKLAKIVSPFTDEQGRTLGHRVVILGLDTTRQPFLLELPPEYANRSIEECERWLLQAGKDDDIIAS